VENAPAGAGSGSAEDPGIGKPVCMRICLDGKKCGKPLLEGYQACEEHRPTTGRITSSGVKDVAVRAKNVKRRRATAYGKILPIHMRDAFKRISRSRDLLSLHNDIALMQVHIDKMVSMLSTNETPEKWPAIRNAFFEFENANRKSNMDGMKHWLTEIKRIITEGNNEKVVWEEIHYLQEKKADLIEKEAKRNYILGGTMTATQAQSLYSAICTIIVTNVRDAEVLGKIRDDIQKLQIFDIEQLSPFDQENL
jgi:hypothetical protein